MITARLTYRFSQWVVVVASALLLWACGDKQTTKGEKEVFNAEKPEWVNQRPFNSAFYIGIGSCSKVAQPLEYQNIAKRNALNDLASEISVRVQGETFLNTLEINKNFSEEFISTINTSTDELIEDFEVAGQYEDKTEYWVYYRMNKAHYQSKKAEKKRMALSQGYDFYLKGKAAEDNANIGAAVDLYLHGLFALKQYWNEVNEYTTESGKIYLDNEIYAAIRRTISGMTIKPETNKVQLTSDNKYIANLPIRIEYNGKPVRGASVSYNYPTERYKKPRVVMTDEMGLIQAEVSGVSSTAKSPVMEIFLNIEGLLPTDLDKTIANGLIKNISTDRKTVAIEMITPSFFIESDEKILGKPGTSKVLSSALQAELVKKGMRMAGNANEANYTVSISSNTTDGGTSQGFTVAFLEMTIVVKNKKTGDIVYQESLNALKGVQLNIDAASIDAYKRGKERIEQQITKSILDSIL